MNIPLEKNGILNPLEIVCIPITRKHSHKNIHKKMLTRKYSHGYLVKSTFPLFPGIALASLAYFWFVLPRSYLFQLVVIVYELFYISYMK